MRMRETIPWAMAAGRAALGPVLIAGESCGWSGAALAAMIVAALVSDIFDGVLARRWKCDSAAVRLFDSMADTFFYACVVVAVWRGLPGVWAAWRLPIGGLLAVEAARIAFDMLKFGKPASYHSYLAKAWGLVLASAVVSVFARQHATPLLTAAVVLGFVCNVEGIAMSLLLPEWRRDVKTLAAAWRLRKEMRGDTQSSTAAPYLPAAETR